MRAPSGVVYRFRVRDDRQQPRPRVFVLARSTGRVTTEDVAYDGLGEARQRDLLDDDVVVP